VTQGSLWLFSSAQGPGMVTRDIGLRVLVS